mmetsp:Transcript_73385/g.174849  ORF Transcript_73385/g.174849 Transcript_73385/m.174849 type:complete len:479 (+) Transcript_73385:124-1560(+)|eukprot:CAMPEP_0178426312 /NCGR_PEP_ID=MMETSP0689_2-20121128/29171_1 /TAXON_ID=160604 /ORGANISM="Amphidinium massartii, Strain CS-259" /LENGTH=478 /DNA_ID=CAMNT_0020047997 /DNA_START=53 /DNA_END=1489 /DNA_ORIENTATION=-
MAPAAKSEVERECQDLREQLKVARTALEKERKVAETALADLKAARAESISALDKLKSAELREQALIGQLEDARKASVDAETMAVSKVAKISAEAAELRRKLSEVSGSKELQEVELHRVQEELLAVRLTEVGGKTGQVAKMKKAFEPAAAVKTAPEEKVEVPEKEVEVQQPSKVEADKQEAPATTSTAVDERATASAKQKSKSSKGKNKKSEEQRPVDQRVSASPAKDGSKAVATKPEAPEPQAKPVDVAENKASLEKVAKQAAEKLAARIAALEEHRKAQEKIDREHRERLEEERREREQELLEQERQRQEDEEREREKELQRKQEAEAAKERIRMKAEKLAEKKRMEEEMVLRIEDEKRNLSPEDFEALQALRAEVHEDDEEDSDEELDDELLLEKEMRRVKNEEAEKEKKQQEEAAKKPLNLGQLLMQMEGLPAMDGPSMQEKVQAQRRAELKEKLKSKREMAQFVGGSGGRRMKR